MSATTTTDEDVFLSSIGCCDRPMISDLTHGKGEHRNYYCHKCGSHQWKGKKYTRAEWERWVNEVDV